VQASITGFLLKAEAQQFNERDYVQGDILVLSEKGRAEVVRYTADPVEGGKGMIGLAAMTPLHAEVEVTARTSQEGRGYLSVRLHSYAPESKASTKG
jgi:hypothetical protein